MALLNRLPAPPLPWLAATALVLAGSLQGASPGVQAATPAPAGAGGGGLPAPPSTRAPRVPLAVSAVPSVDLSRYAGGWYEVARIPNRFQRQCARHTVAVYGLRPDGRLNVLNQCIKRNGNVDQASGVAKVVDPASRAKLKVSLVSFLGWRPFWGDYWVIGLDDAYRWAVVGSPDRRYGWVLARTPALDATAMAAVEEVLVRNGYNSAGFRFTGGTL